MAVETRPVAATAAPALEPLPPSRSARWYIDDELWALERDRVFGRAWQYAGLTTQIPNAGDYFTCRAGHVPVVVVRAETGQVNAFVNVCRHRGHEVVTDASGSRKTLQCRYHGWTYGLDGKLRVARRSEQDPDFHRRCPDGLFPLQVETWGALVFVNPDPGARPFADYAGEWQERVLQTGIDLDGLREHERRAFVFESNWKVLVENTLECYHCAVCHPGLAQLRDLREDVWYEAYEYASAYGAPTRKDDIKRRDNASPFFQHAAETPDALGTWVWPNLFFTVFPGGGAMIATAQPDPFDVGRSLYLRQYSFADDMDEAARADFTALFDQVVSEDQPLCASVQRGFHSGFYDPGPLMPRSEPGIIQFTTLFDRVVRD
jgi:choline monooxygenase